MFSAVTVNKYIINYLNDNIEFLFLSLLFHYLFLLVGITSLMDKQREEHEYFKGYKNEHSFIS